mgnify:CR=1 FL=1
MKIKELLKKITGQDKLDIIIENQNKASKMNARIILQTKFEAEKAKGDALLIEQQYKEEIKQVEKNLETTIDQQYAEIQKLRTQLEHATNNRVGKFYVFNPQHGQPRKIYDSYKAAMKDAESVAKISKGQKVFVLKIVSGVQISENYEDYSLIPEEEIPF